MSSFHHGAEDRPMDAEEIAAQKRLIAELLGHAERVYPQGRISGDDLGETAFAIAADPLNKVIRIQFTKPMTWLGLDVKTATKLRDLLTEKIREIG